MSLHTSTWLLSERKIFVPRFYFKHPKTVNFNNLFCSTKKYMLRKLFQFIKKNVIHLIRNVAGLSSTSIINVIVILVSLLFSFFYDLFLLLLKLYVLYWIFTQGNRMSEVFLCITSISSYPSRNELIKNNS